MAATSFSELRSTLTSAWQTFTHPGVTHLEACSTTEIECTIQKGKQIAVTLTFKPQKLDKKTNNYCYCQHK